MTHFNFNLPLIVSDNGPFPYEIDENTNSVKIYSKKAYIKVLLKLKRLFQIK